MKLLKSTKPYTIVYGEKCRNQLLQGETEGRIENRCKYIIKNDALHDDYLD